MTVRAYEDHDLPYLKRLMEELQRYIVSIDPEGLNILADNFADLYTANLLRKVNKHRGCIFVAEENDGIVGMVAGIMEDYDGDDRLTYKCPAEGRIIELYVNENNRCKSIGSLLMERMERFFLDLNCEYIRVAALSGNENAMGFYESHGYQPRTVELLRRM